MKNDNVNHPAHYNHDGIETIDVIKAWTKGLNPFDAYCMGNTIKYISRWKDKNGIEDLKKARWYLNRIIGEENKEKVRWCLNETDADAVPKWAQKMKDCLEKHAEQTNQTKESPWIKVDSKPLCEDIDRFLYSDCYNAMDMAFRLHCLDRCVPKEESPKPETLDKSTAIRAFNKNGLSIVFTADDNVSITDKMMDCIKYLDTNGYRREHLIIELFGYLTSHPTAWKNKWSIVISLAGCRPDGKWIDICVAQDDFRDCPTINDKPYYIWPSEVD